MWHVFSLGGQCLAVNTSASIEPHEVVNDMVVRAVDLTI